MDRTERLHPTGAAVVIGAVLGAVALAGCGAGQITQTSSQVAAVGGANAGNAEMEVRDARIEFAENARGAAIYGRGTDAPLSMSIVNSGVGADRLVSATSPAAASVEISGELEVPGGQVLRVEGEPPAASGAAAAPSATAAEPAPTGAALAPSDEKLGENSGGTQDEADAQGASPEEAPGVPVTSAPGASAPATESESAEPSAAAGTGVLGPRREAQIVFSGLREDVRAGLTYPLVLTFERAGQITLDVPVANSDEPREDEPAE